MIGAHTANAISGDFSVEARNAYAIKDGQIDKPIRSLMISGNIFEMLKNITGAGMDVRKVGGTVTPSIRVSDMSVVDSTIGSHHFLAYYDKEFRSSGNINKIWQVVPLEDNLFYLTSRTKKFLNINDLKNISPLSDLTLSEFC